MKLTGEVCTLGELTAGDVPQWVGVPGIQIRLSDGRVVTLSGLTREECQEMAPLFLDSVTLTLESV